jgi:hypothetical protein
MNTHIPRRSSDSSPRGGLKGLKQSGVTVLGGLLPYHQVSHHVLSFSLAITLPIKIPTGFNFITV